MPCKSGYCDCPCRDCFEVSQTDFDGNPQLCSDCEESGCSAEGNAECQSPYAYGMGEEQEGE